MESENKIIKQEHRRLLLYCLLGCGLILLIPVFLFMVPLENWVGWQLRAQGYWIIHKSNEGIWYYPTHFSSRPGQKVSNEVLEELHKMRHLNHVSFSDSDFSHLDLSLLTKIEDLRSFSIINNYDSKWSPRDIDKLGGCLRLEDVSLHRTPLTRHDIESLKTCPIKALRFTKTGLSDAESDVFKEFPNLEILQLRDNPGITDASLPVFETITTLKYLELEKTGVTKEGIEAFQKSRPDVKLRTDWMDMFGW